MLLPLKNETKLNVYAHLGSVAGNVVFAWKRHTSRQSPMHEELLGPLDMSTLLHSVTTSPCANTVFQNNFSHYRPNGDIDPFILHVRLHFTHLSHLTMGLNALACVV